MLGLIYIGFIMITMFLLIRDKKYCKKYKHDNESISVNAKDKKIPILIVLCTMLMCYIMGYIFKTDIFNAITLRKNGVSFSFIGIILLFITSGLIVFIIDVINRNREKNKN